MGVLSKASKVVSRQPKEEKKSYVLLVGDTGGDSERTDEDCSEKGAQSQNLKAMQVTHE